MAKQSKAASKKIGKVVKEMKQGKLKTGSGKKVTSRKQAIAIGISVAEKAGKKVAVKKAKSKNSTVKKVVAKKAAPIKHTTITKPSKKAAVKKAKSKNPTVKKAVAKKAAPIKHTTKTKVSKKVAVKKSSSSTKKNKSLSQSKKSTPAAVANKGRTRKMPVQKTPTSTPKKSVKNKKKKPNSNIFNEPPVQDPTILQQDEPIIEKTNQPPLIAEASRSAVAPDKYAVAKGTYHGHMPPTNSKSGVKPSGKKPLWNSGNNHKTKPAGS